MPCSLVSAQKSCKPLSIQLFQFPASKITTPKIPQLRETTFQREPFYLKINPTLTIYSKIKNILENEKNDENYQKYVQK